MEQEGVYRVVSAVVCVKVCVGSNGIVFCRRFSERVDGFLDEHDDFFVVAFGNQISN